MTESAPENETESSDGIELSIPEEADPFEFSRLSKPFKANPTIQHYVQLRREHPKECIEVATSWALDWVFSNGDVLQRQGIDPQIMAGALDADPECICEVSLTLMERLIEREALEAAGESHVRSRGDAVGDSLVNYLIAMMLDALSWTDLLYIPRDLIVLIKYQIGADTAAEAKAQETRERRSNAAFAAAQIRAQGGKGSMRELAGLYKVSPSTVARWFPDNSFEQEVEQWTTAIETGLLDEIREIARELKEKRESD